MVMLTVGPSSLYTVQSYEHKVGVRAWIRNGDSGYEIHSRRSDWTVDVGTTPIVGYSEQQRMSRDLLHIRLLLLKAGKVFACISICILVAYNPATCTVCRYCVLRVLPGPPLI